MVTWQTGSNRGILGLAILCIVGWAGLAQTGCSKPQIGDHCNSNADCPETCQTGGGFPNGFCTNECDDNTQCPTDWVCISDSSGLCVKKCSTTEACVEEFGDGWACIDKSLQDSGGDTLVCYGD